jgi:hypothetical protein
MEANNECRLSEIDLRNNDIGPDQAIYIADLMKLPYVREINLSWNKLGD